MGSSPSHEDGSDAAGGTDTLAPLQLPPTSHCDEAANDTISSNCCSLYKKPPPDLESGKRKASDEGPISLKAKHNKLPKTNRSANINTSTMAPPTEADLADLRVIKEWIEAYGAQPHPSALTAAQRKAISDLKASIAKPVLEPEIGDRDYISALQSMLPVVTLPSTFHDILTDLPVYRDTKNKEKRGVVELSYEDAGHNEQWRCFCNFKGPNAPEMMIFPCEDAGFVVVDAKGTRDAPTFAKKKDARRYAAKCCVDWLKFQKEHVKFPEVNSPKEKIPPPPPKSKPLAEKPASVAPAAIPEREKVNIKADPSEESGSDSEDDIPATERVAKICQRLDFNIPSYKTRPAESGKSGFYDGHPDFGIDAFSFPNGLGHVKGCSGKKETRQLIAQEVLKYLLTIESKRLAEHQKVQTVADNGGAVLG